MLKALIKYRFKQYFKTSKFVMPLLILIVVQFVLYSMNPVGVVESFVLSSIFIFVIMVWAGIMSSDLEDPVSEQIIILRIRSEWKYYISQVLFLTVISAVAAAAAIFFPVVINIIDKNQLFIRPLTAADIVCSYFLLWGSALMGSSLGDLFPARVMRDRKMAILLTVLITIISVTKVSLLDTLPLPPILLCVVPPMSEIFAMFGLEEFYSVWKVVLAVIVLMAYGWLMAGLKIKLLIRNKF